MQSSNYLAKFGRDGSYDRALNQKCSFRARGVLRKISNKKSPIFLAMRVGDIKPKEIQYLWPTASSRSKNQLGL